MPFAFHAFLSPNHWYFVTRIGEAQLMLPTGLVLAGWLASVGERRSAALWVVLLGLAVGLTTATKIAFIGWGLGLPGLNFTGVSGHAMHAAAVLPLLMRCLAAPAGRPTQRAAVAFGYAVAALVATSRVAIGAHSASEAVAGFAVGGLASAVALHFGSVPQVSLPHWLLAALVAAQFVNPAAAPSLPTHDMVTRVALWISGHEKPYTRGMMLRRERERLKALHGATVQVPPRPSGIGMPAYSASAVVFFTSSITA